MKTKTLGLVALIGIFVGLTTQPANAHGNDRHLVNRFGPAYVYYDNGFRRAKQNYRYRSGRRQNFYTYNRRNVRQRDLWHHCFDGRWYPYYDRQHLRFHEQLRLKRGKRYSQRYRYW